MISTCRGRGVLCIAKKNDPFVVSCFALFVFLYDYLCTVLVLDSIVLINDDGVGSLDATQMS